MLIHENKRQFQCQHEGCGKRFNFKMNLIQHQVVHKEENWFKCEYCSHETNNLYVLNDHIEAKHTREGLFKWNLPECDKELTKSNLKKHIEYMHEDVRRFKCKFEGCNFAGKRPKNLNRHVKHVHCKM